MTLLLSIGLALAGVLIAVPLSLAVTRSLRRNPKRSAGFVIASALLFSFPFVNARGPEAIDESKDETRRKKGAQSGDPPVVGGPDA